MKNWLCALITLFPFVVNAQIQEPADRLLNEPAGWEFERFALPPQFAPGIPFKGEEELRFAPGMFNKDSAMYFTYVFVAKLNNTIAVSETEIRDYLFNYYMGLCVGTARERKLSIDSSRITATVERNKEATSKTIYSAKMNIFGVFADGAPVTLNLEVMVMINPQSKKTYLYFLASPRKKKDPLWKSLYSIRDKFVMPTK